MNLFRIESAKFKIGKIAATSLLFNLMVFLLLLGLGISTGGQKMFPTMDTAIHEINNSIIWPGCLIFSGVWAAKIFVQEFRNKTIMNIWSCGIHRRRVVLTKLMYIWAIGMLMSFMSTLLLNTMLLLLHPYMNYSEEGLSFAAHFSPGFIGTVAWNGFCIGITALLSLSFGIRGYSTSATIIASLVVAVVWACQISLPVALLTAMNIRILIMLVSIVSVFFLVHRTKRLDF